MFNKKGNTIKVLLILMATLFLFSGCKFGDWIVTDTGSMVVDEAGELAGIVTGFENVEKIEEMIVKCDTLLLEKDKALKELALQEAYTIIYKKYGHNPQTAYLISKATKLIGVILNKGELEFLAGYKMDVMDQFIVAFRNGLSMATPRYIIFAR